jgi:flagellar hook-associated protein 2
MASITTSTNLDVNGLVSQLMAVEKQPLTKLQAKVQALSSNLSLYGTIKGEVAALGSAADALNDPVTTVSYAASLSDSKVGAVAGSSSAVPGQYSVTVDRLASAQTLVSPQQTNASVAIDVNQPSTLTFSLRSGLQFDVDVGGLSLNGMRDAINSAGAAFGVRASVVTDAGGSRLVLRNANTGVDNAITDISGGSGLYAAFNFNGTDTYSPTGTAIGQSVAASDAQISVDGVTLTSSTNVFATAIEGVTFSATAVSASPVTLSVTRDDAALAAKVQTFVDAYNTVITKNAARYAKGGALASDATLLSLTSRLGVLVGQQSSAGVAGLQYLSDLGVSVSPNKDGTLTFDSAKFKQSLSSNPTVAINLLNGTATGASLFKPLSDFTKTYDQFDGVIQSRRDGITAQQSRLNNDIDRLNRRLTQIETRYRAQFAALDALMGKMQQTSTALTNSLTSLKTTA